VNTLLTRFPKGQRVVDALKLKLDIYKGLRDYSNVLATLEQLKTAAAGKVEPFVLDYEMGRVYFDLCAYTNAKACFASALAGTQDPEQWVRIREALAQTCMRIDGEGIEALSLYRNISQYETSPVRQSVNAMMIYFLEYATSTPRQRKPLPPQEDEFIRSYEGATEAQRAEMGQNELARATWIYYALALQDLTETNIVDALTKLNAASASPDPFLSGEALYQIGMIHQGQKDYRQARDAFLQLLFITKAVEPSVKATYELGRCLSSLGDAEGAFKRFEEVVRRYPISPYTAKILEEPVYKARVPAVSTNSVTSAVAPATPGPGSPAAATPATKAPATPAPVMATPSSDGAALMAISASGVPATPAATNKESKVSK
jgi:tetratricopeptide (TPR) repeat protein